MKKGKQLKDRVQYTPRAEYLIQLTAQKIWADLNKQEVMKE